MNEQTTPMTHDAAAGNGWTRVCEASRLTPERAVAALGPDGAQVALGRLVNGELFAVGHRDPYALANVIARGVIGTRTVEGETFDVIQSPLFKQAFDVRTGEDVADRSVRLGTWEIRERDGVIELGARTSEYAEPEQTTR